MQTGSVKFFIAARGFGFIVPKDGGPDVFVHVKTLRKTGIPSLNEGQSVSFETEPGPDGKLRAAKVELVA